MHVIILTAQELKESFNYGLFLPPSNGKAGKFLDEERRLGDYPFNGPVGYLEVSVIISKDHLKKIRGVLISTSGSRMDAKKRETKLLLIRRVLRVLSFLPKKRVGEDAVKPLLKQK